MATQFPELIPVPLVDPVATAINQSIDRLVLFLEQRRVQLFTELRDTREEMGANRVARQQMEEQLVESRRMLEGLMTHNELRSMQERMVAEMEAKMAQLQANAPPQEVRFLCDTRDLEEHIAHLGEIVRFDIPPIPPMPEIPNYAAFQQPIVAVGKQGSAPGELKYPYGVSIELESGHIYVADMGNHRIQIFSQTGDYLNQFGHQHLTDPWGILIHHDNIYVTDWKHNAIFLFKLSDLTMIKRVGKQGSGNEDFYFPRHLAISPNQLLYVADQYNDRVQILSANLDFQGSLKHQTMSQPVDVKFSNNEIFVLSYVDNPCIHVFSLSGEESRSLVTRGGIGMQVKGAFFFCLDGQNNIVISNCSAHNIKVFSPAGDLLHTIGQEGHRAGMFFCPNGIAINNNKLICLSQHCNFGFQIFLLNCYFCLFAQLIN